MVWAAADGISEYKWRAWSHEACSLYSPGMNNDVNIAYVDECFYHQFCNRFEERLGLALGKYLTSCHPLHQFQSDVHYISLTFSMQYCKDEICMFVELHNIKKKDLYAFFYRIPKYTFANSVLLPSSNTSCL